MGYFNFFSVVTTAAAPATGEMPVGPVAPSRWRHLWWPRVERAPQDLRNGWRGEGLPFLRHGHATCPRRRSDHHHPVTCRTHLVIPEISTSYQTVLKSGPRRSLEASPTASIRRGAFRLPASSSAHAFRHVARTGSVTAAFTPSQTVLPVPQSAPRGLRPGWKSLGTSDGRPPRVPCRRGTRGGTSRFPVW